MASARHGITSDSPNLQARSTTELGNTTTCRTSPPLTRPSSPSGLESSHRLVTYGTLAPGRPNHHRLAHLESHATWYKGAIRGKLVDSGWGAAMGFPALIVDPEAPTLEVWVLESALLPEEWSWLDEFEGEGYQRVEIAVETGQGTVTAQIYVVPAAVPKTVV